MNEERKDNKHDNQDFLSRMLPIFINSLEVGMYVSDFHTGEILFVNRKYAELVNRSPDEIHGLKCWDFATEEGGERCPFCPRDKLVDSSETPLAPYEWEFFLLPKKRWLKSINQAIHWPDGRLAHMVTFYDITETKNMQDRLTNLAFTDQFTQLKNALRLEQDIFSADPTPSIIILDIIALQKINDVYGRPIGDSLLLAVRDWILSQKIPNSELYRIGGDEFCITVSHCDANEIKIITDSLLERFSESWIFDVNGGMTHIYLGASIGVILGDYVKRAGSLLNLIERTLNTAKRHGKVIVYDQIMNDDFKRHLAMEIGLQQSVRENMTGFEVNYQPIADSNGKWVGLESLCRWSSSKLGSVSPILFIPEAERLSLIGQIGIWVLDTAVAKCKELQLDKLTKFSLNINVSSVQFSDDKLATRVLAILQKHKFPGTCLCLEITESTQFTFSELSLQTINKLRAAGISVALDDFGTGYSNFNNLKKLPIDIVKIERDFVADIETNSYQQYLFHAMAELAHTAGKKLVAEGVENEQQVSILLESGADYLQGYFFGKPMPEDQLCLYSHKFT